MPSKPRACPNLELAYTNLPTVLQLLTNASLESMANLIPEGMDFDETMAEHLQKLSHACAQIEIDEDKLNPRWNKAYGQGGTSWTGDLRDGKRRGGMPYFCPDGWVRFSLRVCPDEDFEGEFGGWGYLYHGTKGKFVGSILTSGFRANKGCFCGTSESAVYLSPSIEYCSHPRYGRIEYNPESKHWVQVVLQCRVNPAKVWKKCQETMRCEEFGLAADANFGNDEIEWLFKPSPADPGSPHAYLEDAIVCTGIMVRITKTHPVDQDYWWSRDAGYLQRWRLCMTKVDPCQSKVPDDTWEVFQTARMETFSMEGHPLDDGFRIRSANTVELQMVRMSRVPFGSGSMRFAYYLHTPRGMYVVKEYNEETERHIEDVLQSTLEEANLKDVATYLAAEYYAGKFNTGLYEEWHIHFVEPCLFHLGKKKLFGERFVEGDFMKWNNNTGAVNTTEEARANKKDQVAATYSHFTFVASKGRLAVVDIQGWEVKGRMIFTDPQIHTKLRHPSTTKRQNDNLFRRFSVANFGKTGMLQFLMSHECTHACRFNFGMRNDIVHCMRGTQEVAFKVKVGSGSLPVWSTPATVGNFKFRLHVYPSGSQHARGQFVSAYVEACHDGLAPGWRFEDVHYTIQVFDPISGTCAVKASFTHTFCQGASNFGRHRLVALEEVRAHRYLTAEGELCLLLTCSSPRSEKVQKNTDYLEMLSLQGS